jgi:hypothetical protein
MCARKRDDVSLRVGCACVGRIRARAIEYKRDRCRMSSIIRNGDTFRGISVFGRGVFTNDEYGGRTYAGQCKDGHARGLGVLTYRNGNKEYAEYGPDGQYDGRYLRRWTDGTTYYWLFERGKAKGHAIVSADGRCTYHYEDCAPDDPRLLALIAQVAPVEVRPAARAPHPPLAAHSPPSNRPMDRPARFAPAGAGDRRGHRGAPPFRTPSLVWLRGTPQQQPRCQARPPSGACARPFCGTGLMGGTLVCTPVGPSRQRSLPCHSPAHRRTERWHLGRAVCLRATLPNAAILFLPEAF